MKIKKVAKKIQKRKNKSVIFFMPTLVQSFIDMKEFFFCICYKKKGEIFYYTGYYTGEDVSDKKKSSIASAFPAVTKNISKALKLDYTEEAEVIRNELVDGNRWFIKEISINN